MTADFTLSMSLDGLALASREAAGDRPLGVVPLDAADLDADLARLRGLAETAASGKPLRTAILLPDDQLKLIRLPGTEPDDAEAARVLTGATPYAVADLAWGHAKVDGALHLAAVARETLAEAEAFAAAHGFGPVGFIARPAEWRGTEVWFGDVVADVQAPQADVEAAARAPDPASDRGHGDVAGADVADPVQAVASEAAAPPSADEGLEVAELAADEPSTLGLTPAADEANAEDPELRHSSPGPTGSEPGGTEATPEAPAGSASPLAAQSTLDKAPAATARLARPTAESLGLAEAFVRKVGGLQTGTAVGSGTGADPSPTSTSPARNDVAPASDGAAASPEPALGPPRSGAASPATDPGTVAGTDAGTDAGTEPRRSSAAPEVGAPAQAAEEPISDTGVPEPVFASRARPSLSAPPRMTLTAPPRLGGTADLAANPARQRVEPTVGGRSAPPVAPTETWALETGDAAVVVDEPAAHVDPQPAPVAAPAVATVDHATAHAAPMAPLPPRAADPRLRLPATARPSATAAPAVGAPLRRASDERGPTEADDPFEAAARRGGWLAASGPHGRPGAWRLAAVLTALLIAALVALALLVPSANAAVRAAWAAMTGGSTEVASSESGVAAAEPSGVAIPSVVDAPAPAPDNTAAASESAPSTAAAPGPDALTDASSLLAAALQSHAEERTAALSDSVSTAELPVTAVSPQEADRVYAATGIWLRAPRLTVEPDLEAVAPSLAPVAVAPQVAAGQAPRLGGVLRPDAALGGPMTPPLPGTTYTLDSAGRIAATPEGVVAPSGVRLIAGQPSLVPPTRPGPPPPAAPVEVATATTAAPADPTTGSGAAGLVTTEPGEPPPTILAAAPGSLPPSRNDAAFADRVASTLASAGPSANASALPTTPPDALVLQPAPSLATLTSRVPPSRPADRDPTELAPSVTAKFEGPRPPQRPDSVVAAAEAQAPAETVDLAAQAVADALANPAAAASTQGPATVQTALAGILAGAPDPLAGATASAVRSARRPDVRPAAFDRVVSDQLARASAATAQPTAQASGSPETVEASEPDSASNAAAVPSGPTAAGVAQVATVSGAISLGQMNVIGIYGQPGAQTALVRMGNGRMVRVSVGDSLDGGQVVAIQDNALQLARGGRTELLVIPGL